MLKTQYLKKGLSKVTFLPSREKIFLAIKLVTVEFIELGDLIL
ncbi:hypothetical protein M2447_002025 [Ereboglobus sp. PH5-10]|nr:hypothetical protein [Ereboglobus sp. PH5-10]